jgi:hypothetical protein
MEDLRKLQSKPKVSISEINDFILQHPNWATSIISNALGLEMYREFCLCCENFDECCEKLGAVKKEPSLGCICNGFLNNEHSGVNRPRLRTYFKQVTVLLNI